MRLMSAFGKHNRPTPCPPYREGAITFIRTKSIYSPPYREGLGESLY